MSEVAIFKIKSAFQITGRQFFIVGEILSGKVKKGMIAELSNIGIDKKFTIEAVEFVDYRNGNKAWADIGLGFSTLNEDEKKLLKTGSSFAHPISIIEKSDEKEA